MSTTVKSEPAISSTTAGAVAKTSGRRMHFPYTFSAQIAQFPYRFYYEKSPIAPYLILGIVFSMPLFWQLQKMANSPENIRKWDEIHEHQRNHPKPWED